MPPRPGAAHGRVGDEGRSAPRSAGPGRSPLTTTVPVSRNRLVLAILLVSTGCFAMMQTVINPILPTVQHELGVQQSSLTWIVTSYLLAAAVLTPLLGRVGDAYGRRGTLIAALLIFATGCFVGSAATSVGWLVAARALQGFGGAIVPLSFGIIRDEFPSATVPRSIGFIAAVTAAGGGIGVVIAGPTVDVLGLPWVFLIPGIAALVSAAGAWAWVPPTRTASRQRVPVVAGALLVSWAVLLIYGIIHAPAWGWLDVRTIATLSAGALTCALWVSVELRSSVPLVDMRIMRRRSILLTNFIGFVLGATMFASIAFLPQYIQTPTAQGYGFGASLTESGLLLLPLLGALFLAGMISGRLAGVVPARLMLAGAALLLTCAFTVFAYAINDLWSLSAAQVMLGLSLGLAFAGTSTLVVQAVPFHQSSSASAMNINIRTLGGALGASVMSTIVTAGVAPGSYPEASAYTHGFLVFAALPLAAVGLAMALPAKISLNPYNATIDEYS